MASNREIRLQQAIADYNSNRYQSIRAAAAANDIDHTTLSRRLKGQVSRQLAQELKQLYSDKQEELLVALILDLEAQGHAPTFATIRELVSVISKGSGGPEKVGKN